MSDFDPIAVLEKCSAIPPSSFTYRPTADDDTLREFDTGVVFVMAFWSGPCLKAFRSFTETLASLESAPPVLVVDIDGLDSQMIESIMSGLTNGWGETFGGFWGGQIVRPTEF